MCLVSLYSNNDRSIITSNRDEAPSRSATSILTETRENAKIMYPADTKGGSWIAVGDNGYAVVLLNGALHKHERVLPYRMSRGHMLKEFFDYGTPADFLNEFDFINIEPFTMVVHAAKDFVFRWDGRIKNITTLLQGKMHVFSSCTLYNPEVVLERQEIFGQMISEFTPQQINKVHLTGKTHESTNDFVMNREDIVKTVSVTQIVIQERKAHISYTSLHNNQTETHQISMK